MHLPPSPARLLSPIHPPCGASSPRGSEGHGATTSSAEMAIIQAHQKQPAQAKTLMVSWEVRRSDATKNTDADLGTSCKPFDEDMRLVGMYRLRRFANFGC